MKAYLIITYEIDEIRLAELLKQNRGDNALNILNYEKSTLDFLETTALKKIKSQIIFE